MFAINVKRTFAIIVMLGDIEAIEEKRDEEGNVIVEAVPAYEGTKVTATFTKMPFKDSQLFIASQDKKLESSQVITRKIYAEFVAVDGLCDSEGVALDISDEDVKMSIWEFLWPKIAEKVLLAYRGVYSKN